ncbi:hypothetical protein [Streptomyces anulatus]|uniref:hypothetical protein n=1 Tax=Streptomyces anulatus TaxID=1892 RepID=UPI001C26C2EE|nr:hypothetical protein [Streptomyces anulatus]
MDTQQNTALTRALAEVPGPLPARGVIHIVIPHTDRFTVVGNHLAQHPGLSTTAVGFAVRIQSLPQGTEIGVKALAARFPEGEKLIAAALRELEAIGYLQRARTRLPDGRIVTRTVFCNQPSALLRLPKAAPHQPATPQAPAPAPTPRPVPALPFPLQPIPELEPTLQPVQVLTTAPQSVPAPAPKPEPLPPLATTPECAPAPPPQQPAAPRFVPLVPPPTAPKLPPRPLPQPCELTPELHRAATALLADLRRHTPEFTLTEVDIQQLAPAVAAWLEREARPDTIRHVLTNDPPQPLRHPAKLLRHRLTVLLPPPLPGAHDLAVPVRRVTVTPFQTCDGCERAFRSSMPGRCRDCRTDHAQAAA